MPTTTPDKQLTLAHVPVIAEEIKSYAAPKTDLDKKVDKVEGKGLSTNDYTTADKRKLAALQKGIVNLGEVSSAAAAFSKAAERTIAENHDVHEIHWRAGGDSGIIFQTLYGGYYCVQFIPFEGQRRKCRVRMITLGGNYSVGEWQTLILPTGITYNAQTRQVAATDPDGGYGFPDKQNTTLFTLPLASASAAGLMSATHYSKLSALPSDEDLQELIQTIPSPQSTASATAADRVYVYCVNSSQAKDSVLNAPDTHLRIHGDKLRFQRGIWNPSGEAVYYGEDVPCATASHDGAMSKEDKAKLNSYPATPSYAPASHNHGEASQVKAGFLSAADKVKLDNLNVYGRTAPILRAVNGCFSLKAGATDAQIKATLMEYTTKAVITRVDLEYCASKGCYLYNEETQGLVRITHNGGGFFNLVELSQLNYGELPMLRFVGLRAMDDGTYRVTRPGQQERIAFQSELDSLIERIEQLEQRLAAMTATE